GGALGGRGCQRGKPGARPGAYADQRRRAARRADRHRVRAAAAHGAPARPCVHASPTAGRGARRRGRIVRARYRRAHQEHPPQARERPARSADHPDGVRCRLPRRRAERVTGRARRPWGDPKQGRRPPWWPEGEGWPPPRRGPWHRGGRRMARRAGCAFALFVIVITGSIASFVALVLGGLGVIQPLRAERVLSITGLVLAGIAVSVSIVVVRRVAAPTRELIEAAHRIESGDHSTRINERGPAPVRSVARALNAMSARIEAEEVRRRSVLADVAHELRTSLTIVRGQAEAISDGVYPADAEHVAPILAATHALEALTDDLRTLALAEAGA